MADSPAGRRSIPLQFVLLGLIAGALLAGVVPAGLALERWLERELKARAERDVALAPAILADRTRAIGDAMMMHAKELAHSPALLDAMRHQDRERARRVADEAAKAAGQRAVLVGSDGTSWEGPSPNPELIEATRRGEMPVAVIEDSAALFLISLAGIEQTGNWMGAAGMASPLDEAAAGALAGLTRSDFVLIISAGGTPVALSADLSDAAQIVRAITSNPGVNAPLRVDVNAARYLVAAGPLAGATVAFVRDLRRELAMLPQLRVVLAVSGAAALLVALLLGWVLAQLLVRPVRALASAADRLSQGDFGASLPGSPVRELQRVTQAFETMRNALSVRIEELRAANRKLEDRQARLAVLQSELLRRERVAVSGRMAALLAHEIRNPVANLRNCLELLHRRLHDDLQGREYASLAIDELLRMHELAERMLDLNRTPDAGTTQCDAAVVARQVAALMRLDHDGAVTSVQVNAPGPAPAAIPPEALKQVLLNLLQNAREAVPRGLVLDIDVGTDGVTTWVSVSDNGPGVSPHIRSAIFDPLYTTRAATGGLGLGLFLVEGVVRGHGGSVEVTDRAAESGACFHIKLPAAPAHKRELESVPFS